jgi:hypothetical protein
MVCRIIPAVALLALVALIGLPSASSAEAKKTGDVPWLPVVSYCIDFDNSTICGPGSDADGYADELEAIVGSDPNDAESTPEYGLLDEQTRSNTCHDGLDNDGDGRSDRADPGCRVTCHHFATGLVCWDRDHDGWLQYVETAYGSDPDNGLSTPETSAIPSTCSDGIDNDKDGDVDDADDQCLADGISPCIDFRDTPDCPPF